MRVTGVQCNKVVLARNAETEGRPKSRRKQPVVSCRHIIIQVYSLGIPTAQVDRLMQQSKQPRHAAYPRVRNGEMFEVK